VPTTSATATGGTAYRRRARAGGRPVEYVESAYRGDRYQLTYALELPPRRARRAVAEVEDADAEAAPAR
jgi:hypothetical protein